MMEPNSYSTWVVNVVMLLLVLTVQNSTCLVSRATLPQVLQDCYNRYAYTSLRNVVGQSICWSCESPVVGVRQWIEKPLVNTPPEAAYLDGVMKEVGNAIKTNGAGQPQTVCRRKEYRMLSDVERNRFHGALNILKRDKSRYDVIARLHDGAVLASAHNGPNFLGWHRVYLRLLEKELQSIDPNICLPYWASSLDNELTDPSTSYIFSPDFLGGGTGFVTDGPFANWMTGNGPLRREVGGGALYSVGAINNILSQEKTKDITHPNASPENNIELHHNGVHLFVGGQMSDLRFAAHDPAFFLHHCFVDYLWEGFRKQQIANGIDPEADYPKNYGLSVHGPLRQMDGFNWTIANIDGYSKNLTSTYEYDPSPTCSFQRPSCGSKYLQCNLQSGRCLPIDPTTSARSAFAAAAGQVSGQGSGQGCSNRPKAIQNSFCIDGVCDIRGWVYLAVKVVSKRSPSLHTYNSYKVYNGSMWEHHDIYDPSSYTDTHGYFSGTMPKGYDKCQDGNGVGQIYIQASGLNYAGSYKESVIIDQRLATSMTVGFVAVKDPKKGSVEALFRAYDSCGRICSTACKIPGTTVYQPCPGVLDIEDTLGKPKQYSQTYGEASLGVWNYTSNPKCPIFKDNNIVLTFYCDYNDEIPWVNKDAIPPPTSPSPQCQVSEDCIIDVPCDTSACSGERYGCRGSCNMYAECNFGRYWVRHCPRGWSYDWFTYQCNPHELCDNAL